MKYDTLRKYCGDMPPLRHYPKKDLGEPFRWEDSEVIDWILEHTRVIPRLFESLQEAGAIVFDPDSGTWRGYRHFSPCSKIQNAPVLKNLISEHNAVLKNPYPYFQYGYGGICEHRQTPNPLGACSKPFLSTGTGGREEAGS